MKQSEMKHWKWDGGRWGCTSGHMEYGTLFFEIQEGCLLRGIRDNIDPAALTELARIAEHYRDTGRFGPDPEEPTREQVRKWLAYHGWYGYSGNVWTNDFAADHVWKKGSTQCAVVVCKDDPIALSIDAIALIESRDPEEIRREMVEL